MSVNLDLIREFFDVAVVTQGFGPTDFYMEPAYGGYAHFHMGIDYGIDYGWPIPCIQDGIVTQSGFVNNGYGIQVDVSFGDNCYVRYGHQLGTNVNTGDYIPLGGLIGWVDSTGASTGNHLHLGIWCDGVPMDPGPYVNAALNGYALGSAPLIGPPPPAALPGPPYEDVIPNCVAAFDGFRANVNNILPSFYALVLGIESGYSVRGGGAGAPGM